jgi:hypothetical protein
VKVESAAQRRLFFSSGPGTGQILAEKKATRQAFDQRGEIKAFFVHRLRRFSQIKK